MKRVCPAVVVGFDDSLKTKRMLSRSIRGSEVSWCGWYRTNIIQGSLYNLVWGLRLGFNEVRKVLIT